MSILRNISLAPHTWMKVGGPADFFLNIREKKDLEEAFQFARKEGLPIVYLGQGSNLIFPDEGIRGLVIHLENENILIDQHFRSNAALVHCEAGKILSRLIVDCRRQGLSGLNNFVGIPGVVGAAVRGNIGIPTQEFGELIRSVEVFDGEKFFLLDHEDCQFRYRGSRIKDEYLIVWSVDLIVQKGESAQQDRLLRERVAKQPKGHSCGSFFKNIDTIKGPFAGKLIEECGLKGKKIGGAFVSEKHGNFLMNDGTASAKDLVELAREVKNEVLAKKGIVLENEVLIVDEFGKEIQL